MDLEHVVLIKFPEDLTDQEVSWIDALFASWPNEIGGIKSLRWGNDVSGRSQGRQFGLVITFESAEAAAAYQPHPKHREFADWVQRRGGDVLAFDFAGVPGRVFER